MKKRDLIIHKIITGLFTALVLMGASQYFFNHEMVVGMFESLAFPTYLIYPVGVVKILGLIAIWSNISKSLKEWAYAGFVFNFLLGISAHVNVQDGGYMGAVIALLLVLVSYVYDRKVYAVA